MASKKTKAPAADDNLDELFSGIGSDAKAGKAAAPKSSKAPGASKAGADKDILADLESQLASEPPTSRPHTPRVGGAGKRPTAAPPVGDDKRRSTDSAPSARASFTPSATSSELQDADRKTEAQPAAAAAAGGGWWGGILSTASAAMKQAEAAYKEVQQNEDAKKWAEQVRGFKGLDIGALRHYGKIRHGDCLIVTGPGKSLLTTPVRRRRLASSCAADLYQYPQHHCAAD